MHFKENILGEFYLVRIFSLLMRVRLTSIPVAANINQLDGQEVKIYLTNSKYRLFTGYFTSGYQATAT